MTLPVMTQFAKKKGLGLLTTGDWTHPLMDSGNKAKFSGKRSEEFIV